MDSNEFYIDSVWNSMGAWRDINILDNADASLLEKNNWEWLGSQRTKPFGMHLRKQKEYIHKDRCPRHEDPRLHTELPESPYQFFFPIPNPTDWRPPRDSKFDRLPIASYSTGFDFGKKASLLTASGCFNIPNQANASGARPKTGPARASTPYCNYPEKRIPRARTETLYSTLVPLNIRGRSIDFALGKRKEDNTSEQSNNNNEKPILRNSYSSLQSSLRVRSHDNSKRPSMTSTNA